MITSKRAVVTSACKGSAEDHSSKAEPQASKATAFDSFMRDLNLNRVRTPEGRIFRETNFDRWALANVYDFGGRLSKGSPEFIGYELFETLFELGKFADYRLIGTHVIITGRQGVNDYVTFMEVDDEDIFLLAYADHEARSGWVIHTPEHSLNRANLEPAGHALLLLLGYLSRVEVVPVGPPSDRLRSVNRRRHNQGFKPVSVTRTIHLSDFRKVYESRPSEPRGGTHASPVEHLRQIRGGLIHPTPGKRQFRPYQRRPRVIVVNEGKTKKPPVFTFVEA